MIVELGEPRRPDCGVRARHGLHKIERGQDIGVGRVEGGLVDDDAVMGTQVDELALPPAKSVEVDACTAAAVVHCSRWRRLTVMR